MNIPCPNDYDAACADMVRVAYLSTTQLDHKEAVHLCLGVATYAAKQHRLSPHKAYALWFQALAACALLKVIGMTGKFAADTLEQIKSLRPPL